MSGKTIDLRKTVYELCTEFPEIFLILEKLGFKDITKPGMVNTAGRFMTIPKGAAIKKIDLEAIKTEFTKNGFEIKE